MGILIYVIVIGSDVPRLCGILHCYDRRGKITKTLFYKTVDQFDNSLILFQVQSKCFQTCFYTSVQYGITSARWAKKASLY